MIEKRSEKKIRATAKCIVRESTTLNAQSIELNVVRNKLETFQATTLRDVEARMGSMIDELMQELRQHQMQTNEFHNFAAPQILQLENNSNAWSTRNGTTSEIPVAADLRQRQNQTEENKTEEPSGAMCENGAAIKSRSSKKLNTLPVKVFVMRESFLTDLLKIDHMKTIYHIFHIILLCLLLNNISYDLFVKKRRVTFGLNVFRAGLENIHKIAGIWIVQHVFVFGIYFSLKGWSHVRSKLTTHKTLQRLWSISCLLVYISTQLLFAYVPTQICISLKLTFVTASILLLESVRLLMKMHSFVKTIAPRVLAEKFRTEQETRTLMNIPNFNKYFYFLFAPTLLYRDEYPRTSTIRWKFALSRFLEVVAVAFLYSYIYEHHIKYNFEHFGLEELNAASLVIKLFNMMMPSVITFLAGFYMILHAWLNFTAELLRFGDRMFYRDWWNADSYDTYYRNWNVVVHDWLYEYIYKDFYIYIFRGSRGLSMLTVFTISAFFHECILGYALQVFFPVMFFFFGGIGVAMIFITRHTSKNFGNVLLWFTLFCGNSMIISLYSMEYFTRINCPKEFNSWTDYLVPHVWSCF